MRKLFKISLVLLLVSVLLYAIFTFSQVATFSEALSIERAFVQGVLSKPFENLDLVIFWKYALLGFSVTFFILGVILNAIISLVKRFFRKSKKMVSGEIVKEPETSAEPVEAPDKSGGMVVDRQPVQGRTSKFTRIHKK